MSATAVGLFLLGLALLVAGAEILVRGASRLAKRVGVSSLVVGLTVVAFGTSSPELAVSVQAGLAGQAGIAVANIVGSNIFNVVILGVSALIVPLAVSRQLVRLDVPLMIGVSVLLLIMALDGRIGTFDGLVLTAGIVAYTSYAIRQGRRENRGAQDKSTQEFGGSRGGWLEGLPVQIAFVGGGLALLVLGAGWLVEGAASIARALGVGEVVIGLTVIAAGTSLPELATSIVAAWHGERDIAVGNIVGSNIFNLLAIGGIAALATPGGLAVADALIRVHLPVMLAVALACMPVFSTGLKIARWEGAVFLGCYVAYVCYLILEATGHAALPSFRGVMSWVLPLTAAALVVPWVRQWAARGARQTPPG